MTPAARLIWVTMHERTGDAGLTCRRCGASRPTLGKWWRRCRNEGEAGLLDRSRRPRRSPARRADEAEETRILALRRSRKPRIKRLRNELLRQHGLRLAIDTIHKGLRRHGLDRLERPMLNRKAGGKRCSRPVPGDRGRMDVCRIAPRLCQCTAIDDCSRCRVEAVFPRRSAKSTLIILDQVVAETPVSIQRIQTDRGQELLACKVQEKLRDRRIKLRPIRPRSPLLDGRVERVRKTALEEFRPTADPNDPELDDRLAERRRFCNWERPHDGLDGMAPIDRVCERIRDAPVGDEIEAACDLDKEFIAPRDGWPWRRSI